jgi:hypothetical protein
MMRPLCLAVVMMGLSVFAYAQSDGPTTRITLRIVNENRGPALGQLRRFLDNRGNDLISHFSQNTATGIPYGVYRYVIERSPGAPDTISGEVSIWVSEVLHVVCAKWPPVPGASVDRALPAGFIIRGRLSSVPKVTGKTQLWVRLCPAYSTRQLDVPVDPSGEFKIYEPVEGIYVLIVIGGDQILRILQVSFEENWRSAEFMVPMEPLAGDLLRVRSQ